MVKRKITNILACMYTVPEVGKNDSNFKKQRCFSYLRWTRRVINKTLLLQSYQSFGINNDVTFVKRLPLHLDYK